VNWFNSYLDPFIRIILDDKERTEEYKVTVEYYRSEKYFEIGFIVFDETGERYRFEVPQYWDRNQAYQKIAEEINSVKPLTPLEKALK
jgi:hypothetical protein